MATQVHAASLASAGGSGSTTRLVVSDRSPSPVYSDVEKRRVSAGALGSGGGGGKSKSAWNAMLKRRLSSGTIQKLDMYHKITKSSLRDFDIDLSLKAQLSSREERLGLLEDGYFIHPHNVYKYRWDLFIIFGVCYNAIFLPLQIAFTYDQSWFEWVLCC